MYTPTLTGFGERSHLDVASVTFETFVTDVVNVFRFEDLHDVVLVGHSMGGVIVPRVAEIVPDRIRRVVWIAGAVTADGESLIEAVPQSPWIAARRHPRARRHRAHRPRAHPRRQHPRRQRRASARSSATGTCRTRRTRCVEPGRLAAFLALGLPTGYITARDDRTIEPPVCAKFVAIGCPAAVASTSAAVTTA